MRKGSEMYFSTRYKCRLCGETVAFVLQAGTVESKYPALFDPETPDWDPENRTWAAAAFQRALYGLTHVREHRCRSGKIGVADYLGVECVFPSHHDEIEEDGGG